MRAAAVQHLTHACSPFSLSFPSHSYYDGEVDLVQARAILRHLARRHGLAGGSVREAALVDVLLEGTADLKGRIVPLVYRPDLQASAAVQHRMRSCCAAWEPAGCSERVDRRKRGLLITAMLWRQCQTFLLTQCLPVAPPEHNAHAQTEEAAREHWAAHVAPGSVGGAEAGGAHVLFLQRFIERHGQVNRLAAGLPELRQASGMDAC